MRIDRIFTHTVYIALGLKSGLGSKNWFIRHVVEPHGKEKLFQRPHSKPVVIERVRGLS